MLENIAVDSNTKLTNEAFVYAQFRSKVYLGSYHSSEPATQSCFKENVFWNDAVNLQENTHARVPFQ